MRQFSNSETIFHSRKLKSIFCCFSASGQQSKQSDPDSALSGQLLQLFWGGTEAFPVQLGDIITPACRGCPGRHPEPPHPAPINVEEQQLYSEPFTSDGAPHSVSKEEPRHPSEELISAARIHELFLSITMHSSRPQMRAGITQSTAHSIPPQTTPTCLSPCARGKEIPEIIRSSRVTSAAF